MSGDTPTSKIRTVTKLYWVLLACIHQMNISRWAGDCVGTRVRRAGSSAVLLSTTPLLTWDNWQGQNRRVQNILITCWTVFQGLLKKAGNCFKHKSRRLCFNFIQLQKYWPKFALEQASLSSDTEGNVELWVVETRKVAYHLFSHLQHKLAVARIQL
jgi:hypothetical protein